MTNHESIKTGDPQTVTALSELALLFLKLGAISFGGPAVHIAMMEEESSGVASGSRMKNFSIFLAQPI